MLHIGLCQIASGEDKAKNLARILKSLDEASALGADIMVAPEYAMARFRNYSPQFLAAAEPLEGPFVSAVREAARRRRLSVVLGATEPAVVGSRVFNTVCAIDHEGQIVAEYRKTHLYDAFGNRESDFVRPGKLRAPATFNVKGVKLGVLTCYDLRFPEPARMHADAGVDVLLYPAAWAPGPQKEEQWRVLSRARAVENAMYVVAVSQAPGEGVGCSMVIDPMGVVTSQIGPEEVVRVGSIDPEYVQRVRRVNPSLSQRRYAVTERTI